MNPAGEDYACEQDGLLAGDGDAATRWFGWGGANVSQTPMSPGIDPEGTTPHLVRAAYRKQFSKSLSWKEIVDEHFSQGSIRGSVFNLCSATLGAGALSLPFAVKGMGVALGLLLTVLCGFTTVFSIHLLILARTATGLSSYEEISAHLFGSTAAGFVEFGIVSFCFGTGVAYCKTLMDFLEPLLEQMEITEWMDEKKALAVVWVCMLLPLSMLKSMNALRFSSLFGVMTIAYLVITIAVHATRSVLNGEDAGKPSPRELEFWVQTDVAGIIQAFPIIMFAYTCQVNVFSIFDELERASRQRMVKVTNRSVALCFLLYSLVGVFGFLEFRLHTCGNVLQNFIADFKAGAVGVVLMYVAIALTIVMSFPLIVYPCRCTLEAVALRYFPPSDFRHAMWTVLISGGSMGIAMLVPNISVVFQLVGGTSSALVCFVLPALFAIRLHIYSDAPFFRAAVYALAVGGVVSGALSTVLTLMQLASPAHHPLSGSCKPLNPPPPPPTPRSPSPRASP